MYISLSQNVIKVIIHMGTTCNRISTKFFPYKPAVGRQKCYFFMQILQRTLPLKRLKHALAALAKKLKIKKSTFHFHPVKNFITRDTLLKRKSVQWHLERKFQDKTRISDPYLFSFTIFINWKFMIMFKFDFMAIKLVFKIDSKFPDV